MQNNNPLMVQCDFDGTVTIGDLSFLILDYFTNATWRQWYDDYTNGKVTVNEYNIRAFGNVTASKNELESFTKQHVVLREGLMELINFCKLNNIRFCFISNGMDFYIETVLKMISSEDIEYAAATTLFTPQGILATYFDPYGKQIQNDFKVAYTRKFKQDGFRIAYIGNGLSDFKAASMCDYIFGIDELATQCNKNKINYNSFNVLTDIIPFLIQLI